MVGFLFDGYILDLKPRGMRTHASEAGPARRRAFPWKRRRASPVGTTLPGSSTSPGFRGLPNLTKLTNLTNLTRLTKPYQAYQPYQNLPIEVDAPCFPQKSQKKSNSVVFKQLFHCTDGPVTMTYLRMQVRKDLPFARCVTIEDGILRGLRHAGPELRVLFGHPVQIRAA